jgi:hypothetical protein
LNLLGLFLNPLGPFLRTPIPFIWRILSACPPASMKLPPWLRPERTCFSHAVWHPARSRRRRLCGLHGGQLDRPGDHRRQGQPLAAGRAVLRRPLYFRFNQ